ncbi:MAG: phosphotransferase, partial [Actinomycetota bacterium]
MTGDVFGQAPPQVTDADVAAGLRVDFGLSGSLASLDSERDRNLRLTGPDGEWVVKVANVAEHPATLDLQHRALDHVARVDPALPVPRVWHTIDGSPTARWTSDQGEHLVRCVTWLPGRPLATVPRTDALERHLGHVLGRLSAALVGFSHPAAHRPDFLWNLDRAQDVRPWTADIADPADRALVERAFERHLRRAVPLLPLLRAAAVHHDANDYNVLADGDEVTGLIDFGDMLLARQVNELAVALAYALLDQADLVAVTRRVVGGYVAEFALDERELQVLFDLVVARLAMSVTISS